MQPPTDWTRAADPDRRIGHEVEFHASIGSTNDRARELLREHGDEGVSVVADHQSAGRGRRGRTWLSPQGANLMVSVAIRPRLEPARAGLLGLAAALAVRDACADAAPEAQIGIRWPNDVVTTDGLKLAGLLLETTLAGERLADAVIGAGVNVNWPRVEMPQEIRDRATSLAELAGRPVDRVALLHALLARLDAEVRGLEAGGSPVGRFSNASVLDGREIRVEVGDGALEGVAAGIAPDGALLIDTPGGRVAMSVGEVVAVRDRPAEVRA
jgi:BirA family biotin operon repressor/biotin-[acetyl-CoA-carboxylase] ligase